MPNQSFGLAELLHRVLPERSDPIGKRMDRHLMHWARRKYSN
jgi:hypothetical protein